jgi:hypothetical protein
MTAPDISPPVARVRLTPRGPRTPVWTEAQLHAHVAVLGGAIETRLKQAEDELREFGAMDNAMTPVPAGALRELIYELRKLLP